MSEGGSEKRRPIFSRARAAAVETFGANVGVALLSFFNVLIVSRALGPTGRGQVALLTTIANITHYFVCLGLQEANVNIAGAKPHLRGSLATNSVIIALVVGTFAIAVLGGLTTAFPAVAGNASGFALWVALASIPVVVLQDYLARLVQADYQFVVSNLAILCCPVTTVLVNGAGAALGLITVTSAVTAWVVGQAIGTTLLIVSVIRGPYGFGRPDRALARRALAFGVKVWASIVMNFTNYRLDQWLLGGISGPRQLGFYSVAVSWAESLFLLPRAVSFAQRPGLVRAEQREAARQTTQGYRAVTLLTVLIVVGLVLLAPFLCATIFGPQFSPSIRQLRMLAPGALGIVALQLLGNGLTARNRPLLQTAGVGVAFAVTIPLDLLLIPPLGGFGAAIASTVAYVAGGLSIMTMFTRVMRTRPGDLVPRGADVSFVVRVVRDTVQRLRARRLAAEG